MSLWQYLAIAFFLILIDIYTTDSRPNRGA